MAAALAQFNGDAGNSTDPTLAFPGALTAGSTLFIIGLANSTVVGVTDSASHTWTERATVGTTPSMKAWTAPNTGTTTPTVTFDHGGSLWVLFIGEVTGGTFGDTAITFSSSGVSISSGATDAATAADSLGVGAVVVFGGTTPTMTNPTEVMEITLVGGSDLPSILGAGVVANAATFTTTGTLAGEDSRYTVAILFNASGAGSITGTAAVTLGTFVAAGSGTRTVPSFTGTTAVTLGTFTAAASGTRTLPAITGTTAVTLAPFTASASGTVAGPGAVTGTAAVTLAPFVAAASGTRTLPSFTGTAAVTLSPFLAVAAGTVIVAVTGTAAVTLNPFTSTAAGTTSLPPIVGTAAITLGPFIAFATSTPIGGVGIAGIRPFGTAAATTTPHASAAVTVGQGTGQGGP